MCFIDADFVLIEERAGDILDMAADPDISRRRFQFCQPCGDFYHIARPAHTDRCCHQYVDIDQVPDFEWQETPAGFGMCNHSGGPASDRVLFWHLNLVRPDHRLVQRLHDRAWHTDKQDRHPAKRIAGMDNDRVHEKAMERLQNKWQSGDMIPCRDLETPPRPQVLQDRKPGRFVMVWDAGEPVDRHDRGWTKPWERQNE
jgi:hypothetical protein